MTMRFVRGLVPSEDAIKLSPGSHKSPDDGLCAMEAVAWISGARHTDQPQCTTEVIAAYIRHLNDNMPDNVRPRLLAYLPRIIGIPEDNRDYQRNEIFARHAVQSFAPAALRCAGYEKFARLLQHKEDLKAAKMTADFVVNELGSVGPNMKPVQWSVYRAGQAANLADWFASKRYDFLKGASPVTPYGACSEAAAGAAFYAYCSGCEEIWNSALSALDEVLALG